MYALEFIPKSTYLVAGSDDMNISFLDFASGQVAHSLKKVHNDFIRTIQPFQDSTSVVLSGSYDKTIKVFDIREQHKLKMTFNHVVEVEDAKLYQNNLSLVSVGNKFVV